MIFVVMGTCGEYSDQMQWPVFYFDTEIKAQEYIENLETLQLQFDWTPTPRDQERGWRTHMKGSPDKREEFGIFMKDLDPQMIEHHDIEDTSWYIMEVMKR